MSKYSSLLKSAQKNAFIRGGLTATTMGLFFGFIYGMYGLGLWYGVKVTSPSLSRLKLSIMIVQLMLDDRETPEFQNCSSACIAAALASVCSPLALAFGGVFSIGLGVAAWASAYFLL